MARHTASSGMRTPTFFRCANLDAVAPYLLHCFGNSLLAVKMKVYCDKKTSLVTSLCSPLQKLEELTNPKPWHPVYSN